MFDYVCRNGWEGLVAKRPAGLCHAERVVPDWRKLKCEYRQELVVGGFTAPRGTRDGFGALLLGYWEAKKLIYAGKVGTGFTQSQLGGLRRRLVELERCTSPFPAGTKTDVARWVDPVVVVEVGFSNWTRKGRLRDPRFLGVRPDKASEEVVREVARPGPGLGLGPVSSPPPKTQSFAPRKAATRATGTFGVPGRKAHCLTPTRTPKSRGSCSKGPSSSP